MGRKQNKSEINMSINFDIIFFQFSNSGALIKSTMGICNNSLQIFQIFYPNKNVGRKWKGGGGGAKPKIKFLPSSPFNAYIMLNFQLKHISTHV